MEDHKLRQSAEIAPAQSFIYKLKKTYADSNKQNRELNEYMRYVKDEDKQTDGDDTSELVTS